MLLAENSAIPVVVLSRQQDPVETINSSLRNAGHPVHCTWVRDLADLPEALSSPRVPQLLFFCLADVDELTAAMQQRAFRSILGSTKLGGTGLGLAIVRRVVEIHRGGLEIKSRRGHGTAMIVTLPV